MSSALVLQMFANALLVAVLVAAPLLIVTLVVGLMISVLQAVTQIQDMSLTFVPKLIAVGITAVVAGPWALDKLMRYATETILSAPAW